MPTTFGSYDVNGDNIISPDEWAQFYPDEGGPAQSIGGGNQEPGRYGSDPRAGGQPAGQPAAPFDLDAFIAKISSGNFTDDDMMAFSNWYMGQQMGQQAGQMDYQNKYLDYLNSQLGLNEQQLAQAKQEMDFQQGPYWEWYTTQYFPHQQERDTMEYDLAKYNLDAQKALGTIEQAKAKDYALGQFYQTEQAKYGADAARWQYQQMTNGELPPNNNQPVYREPRMARAVLGAY